MRLYKFFIEMMMANVRKVLQISVANRKIFASVVYKEKVTDSNVVCYKIAKSMVNFA